MSRKIGIQIMAAALLLSGAASFAETIVVSITNEDKSDFYLSPYWFGFHDGTFDLFDAGTAASPELEALAEDGQLDGIRSLFTSAGHTSHGTASNAEGFGGAPVIDPGETATVSIEVDTMVDRYLSYASMVIPSNDAFVSKDDPLEYEVFDAAGNLVIDPVTIAVFSGDIWDGGTEVNDTLGATFSAAGGISSDQSGVITVLPNGGLDNFLGVETAAGNTIQRTIERGGLVATIRITQVPEPAGLQLAGLAMFATMILRNSRKSTR